MLQGQIANLEGQVHTGASRGIGQAIALALGQAGATVVGTATSDKGAQAISDYLAAAGIKGSGMKLNVTDAAEVDAVIAAIEVRSSATSASWSTTPASPATTS
jgi:3-oxoacyl-[acyl-carrier protein] reductase